MKRTFNYTEAVRAVVKDIIRHVPAFKHVKISKVLFSFAKARQRTDHGVYAKIVPLRFEGGKNVAKKGKKTLMTPKWTFRGKIYLYILYVYMPRFHDQPMFEKIMTLIHELYHISPECDGDLRHFAGGRYHGHSEEAYERTIEPWVHEYLKKRENAEVLDFLRIPTEEIERKLGKLTGLHVQLPTMTITTRQ